MNPNLGDPNPDLNPLRWWWRSRGGSEGTARRDQPTARNRYLTSLTGLVLIPLLGLVFATGLVMDALWHAHYVIGFVLIPVVGVKLSSTGYRAASYYLGRRDYRKDGPPEPFLRLLATLLVIAIAVAMVTGVLMWAEHTRTGSLSTLHTDSSVLAAGALAIHGLAYVPGAVAASVSAIDRAVGRWLWGLGLVVVALLLGLVLAIATYGSATWPVRGGEGHPPITVRAPN